MTFPVDPSLRQDAIDLMVRAAVRADRIRTAKRLIELADSRETPSATTLRAVAKELLQDPQGSGQEKPSVLTTPAPPAEEIKKHLDEYRKAVVAFLRKRVAAHKKRGFQRDMIAYLALEIAAKDIEGNLIRDPSEE